jgi:hypothetical protein
VTTKRVTICGYSHPSTRPRRTWQGRLAVMASRGETTGHRVDECRRALAWYRIHDAIRAEVDRGILDTSRADDLVDQLTGALT